MKKLFALFFVLISTFSFAQEIIWQNRLGGSGQDNAKSLIKTADGGYLFGGNTTSPVSGDIIEPVYNQIDYCIFKMDSLGNVQWQRTFGSNGDDNLETMIQTPDGGYLIGGHSASAALGDKSENSKGGYDFWIIKTDANGIKLWDKTIGGSFYDRLFSALPTLDGGFLLAGFSDSNISGDKTQNSYGTYDYWIVKIDSAGSVQWDITYGGSEDDAFKKMFPTADGGYILTGDSNSPISGIKTVGPGFWMIKINATGGIEWQRTEINIVSFIQTMDGGYLFYKISYSSLPDYQIVKTDSSFNLQWQKYYRGNSYDYIRQVAESPNGGFLVCGVSRSILKLDKTEPAYGTFNYDYWIILIDEIGGIISQNTIGGFDDEDIISVVEDANGEFAVGGYTESNLGGDLSENTNGGSDFWIIKLSNNYNLIHGKTYADLNTNQSQEPGDPGISYLKLTEANSGRFTFSHPNGFYSLAVLDSGNFEVAPDYVNLFNPVPLTHTGNFSAIQQIDSLNDFAFQPGGTFNDLCISISPLGNFRSGFNANYALNYANLGNTTLIPTIVFYPDNNVTFVSASITPTTITPDSVVFILSTMSPFQNGQITITVNVNTGLPIGTLINSGTMILPIANDANPGCNSSFWEVFTTGSYDPNDIIVNRKFIYDYEMPAPPDLEYIIRYQNTGNDTAFTVKILNPLDTNRLDLSTLEMVATSHPADIRFVYHERNLEFVMNNILLPDSNINEPLSHGFVRYRIKPKSTVAVGDSIQNYAAIYFDYNYPVITNKTVTKIIQPTGVQEVPQGNISIFPNPTNSKVTIRLTETAEKVSSVNIFNIFGQEVKAIKILPTHTAEIDISDLSQGVYFIKLNNNNQLISKIVKY